MSVSISIPEARKIILHAQCLTKSNPFGRGPSSVIKAIEHLSYVQLDTISVVERAHHHVLWTRIPAYKHLWLDKAQVRHRKIFEYWAHAASYLPMKDYRFAIPVMDVFRAGKDRWPKTSKVDMKKVLTRINAEGPLMSRDFESTHKGGNWWDWKPAKWALQRLFLEGHLMVSHREGFQRVYDLPERILPSGLDTSRPTKQDYYQFLITSTLRAQGLSSRNDIIHLQSKTAKDFDRALSELEEEGIILTVKVENGKTYYMLPDYLEQKISIPQRMRILSPFDNLIIWRKRLKEIFGFDYTLECYVPAHKRQYGYFCLPVMHKDNFIGRIDLKADRANGSLQIIKEIWDAPHQAMSSSELYQQALKSFAVFNGCEKVR